MMSIRNLSVPNKSIKRSSLGPSMFRYLHDTRKRNDNIPLVPGTEQEGFKNINMDLKKIKNDTNSMQLNFLRELPLRDLFSYIAIGIATLNKPILNACIKVFPYTPMFLIRALVYRIYCGGTNLKEINATGDRLRQRGINNMMLSLTIEACDGKDHIDPDYIVTETKKSLTEFLAPYSINVLRNSEKDINSIPPGYVALKPTGFAKDAAKTLKYFKSDPHYAAKFEELVLRVSDICKMTYNINQDLSKEFPDRKAPFVVAVIDAEKHELQEGVYELQRRMYAKYNQIGKPVSVVGTLQMYLADSANILALEENLAKKNNYRLGLKLVRGAYIHSEKDRSVIHKTKADTDENYNNGISFCIDSILADKANDITIGHLVVATHNAESLKLATEKLNSTQNTENKANVVLGQLLGMADGITYDLIKNHKAGNVIKYVPWGPPIETKEYLLRRLEENGDAVRSDNGLTLLANSVKALFQKVF